ncbi:Pol protein [Phytophthora palmivora]|uniref:Pol protein n=1 Tax=Phytophthora palmivora TaxID=4796 RepID=A0A2P4X4R9_9STRA|nr:Pol protein [Phytophthora palmivora]
MAASPNAESRRAVWVSTVAVPDGTDQAGNIGPQAAEAAEESAKGVSCVGNIGPQVGNVVPQIAEAVVEDAESASGVGNRAPRKVHETEKMNESATCASSVGNRAPRGVKKTNTRAEVWLIISRVDSQVPHSESETPPARPVEDQYHICDGVSGRQVQASAVHLEARTEVSALVDLEELFMKDFLAELKAGEIAEMVFLKPETSPENLDSSSVMDKDPWGVSRRKPGGSSVSSSSRTWWQNIHHPNSHRMEEHGTRLTSCLAQSTVSRGSGLYLASGARQLKSSLPRRRSQRGGGVEIPHSIPTFCVRKPNRKWCHAHAYAKLKNATVPAQTSIPRKDVLLDNIFGCTLYSAVM